MEIDFSPLEGTLNKLFMYVVGLIIACTIGSLLVYYTARLIKIPEAIARFLGVIAVLGVLYIAFKQGFIPNRL